MSVKRLHQSSPEPKTDRNVRSVGWERTCSQREVGGEMILISQLKHNVFLVVFR